MNTEELVRAFAEPLEHGDAALFVGAGLSRPAGFVDWQGLLRDIALDLGLEIAREADLVAVAQYHVNKVRSRSTLDRLILEEFTKDARPSRVHDIIARLPIRTIWTTNYDSLIEDAYRRASKRADVKTTPENVALTLPRRDVVIYKMHGDTTDPARAVITKEDYETYEAYREVFSTTLKADLLTKHFLFLGFSFADPNLEYTLSRIRGLLGEHQREHYCILRPPGPAPADGQEKAQWEYDKRKFELRVADLRRYSIRPVLIDDYGEVTKVLSDLERRVRLKCIFVSGSASDYSEFPQDRLSSLARGLGDELVRSGYRVVTGLGLGVGAHVLVGAMEYLYSDRYDDPRRTEDALAVRPFPHGIDDRAERRRISIAHRHAMIGEAGVTIFMAGNRIDSGKIIESPGVHEEFDITVKLGGVPIPIGATGSASRTLWHRVTEEAATYFEGIDINDELRILGDLSATNESLIRAVLAILDRLTGRK